MSGNDCNMNVFSRRQKEETDGADCTSSGTVFQKMLVCSLHAVLYQSYADCIIIGNNLTVVVFISLIKIKRKLLMI